MKYIVQVLPNELDVRIDNIDINNYKVDQEIYKIFLINIFEDKFWHYVNKVNGDLGDSYYKAKKQNNLLDLMRVDMQAKREYLKAFHETREKFYYVKDKFYSYVYIGQLNTPNELQIIQYDNKEICKLLNDSIKENSKKNKNFVQRLFKI